MTTTGEPSSTLADLKTKAEIRKITAEAQAAEITAALSALPTDFPDETLDVGEHGSPIGVLAAYKALEEALKEIVPDKPTHDYWIVPDGRVQVYRVLHGLIERERSRLETALNGAKDLLVKGRGASLLSAAVGGIALAASGATALLSLLKTDTTVRSSSVEIGFYAAAVQLAKQLTTKTKTDGTPVGVAIAGAFVHTSEQCTNQIKALADLRDEVVELLTTYRIDNSPTTSEELAAAKAALEAHETILSAQAEKRDDPKDLEPLVQAVVEAAREVAKTTATAESAVVTEAVSDVVEQVDTFLKLVTTATDSGQTPLAMADTYEGLKDALVVQLEVSYAGGEAIYEEKIGADRALHTGTVVVSYVVSDSDGSQWKAGQVTGSKAARTAVNSTSITWG